MALVRTAIRKLRRAASRARLLRLGQVGRDVTVDGQVHFGFPRRIRVDSGCSIGRGCALRANSDAPVGVWLAADVCLKDGVLLNANQGRVEVHERSWLGPYCVVYGNAGVRIGRDTMIGAHTVITSVGHESHRLDEPMRTQPLVLAPIVIEDDVWIGAHCSILPGVTIGHGAIVGAGSVVTRDVAPYSIVTGVPARQTGSRSAREAA